METQKFERRSSEFHRIGARGRWFKSNPLSKDSGSSARLEHVKEFGTIVPSHNGGVMHEEPKLSAAMISRSEDLEALAHYDALIESFSERGDDEAVAKLRRTRELIYSIMLEDDVRLNRKV